MRPTPTWAVRDLRETRTVRYVADRRRRRRREERGRRIRPMERGAIQMADTAVGVRQQSPISPRRPCCRPITPDADDRGGRSAVQRHPARAGNTRSLLPGQPWSGRMNIKKTKRLRLIMDTLANDDPLVAQSAFLLSMIGEQSQRIEDDDDRRPFMDEHRDTDPGPSGQRGRDQQGNHTQRDEQVLADDCARGAA